MFKGPCKHSKDDKVEDNISRLRRGIRIGSKGKATSVNVVNNHEEC